MVRVADQALRAEVTAAAPTSRNVQLVQERRIGPSVAGPLANVDAAGADLQARIPPSVRTCSGTASSRSTRRAGG